MPADRRHAADPLCLPARSGKTIRSVTPAALDATGALHLETKMPAATPRAHPHHLRRRRWRRKTLYYFSTDLSNSGVKSSGFLQFCATLAPQQPDQERVYLLHSAISAREELHPGEQRHIIQDDSGIPLAYYSTKQWRFFPFGRYAGPIEKFPSMYQSDTPNCSGGPTDRFRHRLSLAHLRDEPPAVGSPQSRRAADRDTTSAAEPPTDRPPRPNKPRPPVRRRNAAADCSGSDGR